MKKSAFLLTLALLAGCSYADNSINFLPVRNKFLTFWQTDGIFYYDKNLNEEFLAESATVTEDKIQKGQVLITHTGDEMASSKTYRTDYYSKELIKPTKNGTLDSAYSPVYIHKNGKYNAFGEVKYEGEKYLLVREGKSNDILLVNGDGEIYNHIGRIVDGRLAVLSAQFYLSPEDLRMLPVVETRTENSEETSGFVLSYDGLSKDGTEMLFTYQEVGYDPESIRFSICDEFIEIHGLEIDVFNASEDKIEYMIK
ncbi:MAG: hypothetical protein J5896_04885 [Alphaproteobacteria bacterium]|nr:hypothetical protein [Alphaproteobacteria bacterium]